MSNQKYFYIVSRLNGYVLDIAAAKKGGNIVNYLRNGGNNQLWRWDEDSRLISKVGLVLDIKKCNKKSGAQCIGWSVNNGLNQKWRYEEGTIKSSLNDKVLDVKGNKSGSGTPVIMFDSHGSANQKWWLVPEEAWADFKLMQDNLNPLTEAQFWKDLVDNYLEVIIGYTITEYKNKTERAAEILAQCASKLDSVANDTGIAGTVGGSASIAGGGMAIAGLLLAPFTGGLSLGLTVAGAATGVAGAATSLTANLINQHWDKSESKKVQTATSSVFCATFSLQGLLSEYIEKLKRAQGFLHTPEGESIARDAYQISKELGHIAWNAYRIGNTVMTGAPQVKQAQQIVALIEFIQADYYAVHGARIGVTPHAAASGTTNPVLGKTLVAAGTTGARVLYASFGVVGVAFGIWDIVEGAKKITDGSQLGKEFREAAATLKRESIHLVKLCNELQPGKRETCLPEVAYNIKNDLSRN